MYSPKVCSETEITNGRKIPFYYQDCEVAVSELNDWCGRPSSSTALGSSLVRRSVLIDLLIASSDGAGAVASIR